MKYSTMTRKERNEVFAALAARENAKSHDASWLQRTVPDELCFPAEHARFVELWRKAKNAEELVELVKNDNILKNTQFAGEANGGDWYWKRSMMGDKCRKASTDAGSLKIGHDGFCIYVPNGYGDGTTRYAVLNKGEFDEAAFTYFGLVESNKPIDVYSYDCGNQVAEQIPGGCYHLYYSDGLVVIEKIKEVEG